MATYKAYLFNMVTANGSSIEITGKHGRLELAVICENDIPQHVTFRNMDVLQNFISINSEKGLTNEQIIDKLAGILTYSEVDYYE
jgi:hypothetical protein